MVKIPEPYNLTNLTAGNGILDVFTATNQMTSNFFGVGILLVLWFIVFMRLKMYSSKSAMLAASFVTTLIAVMLFLMGMVSQPVLMATIVILAVSFIIMWFD